MKHGYMMAKVVRDKAVCPQIEDWVEIHASDFITTYMLKQCIIKEYAAMYDNDIQDSVLPFGFALSEGLKCRVCLILNGQKRYMR